MADVLRVSTPINGNPSTLQSGNTQGVNVNQVGATRVEQNGQVAVNPQQPEIQSPAYDTGSVFQTFANKLTDTPALTQTLEKLLLGALVDNGTVNAEGVDTSNGVPTLLSELAEKLHMDESQILQNLIFQKDQSTGFSAKVFDILREISENDVSAETTNHIGRFLKAVDSYTSAQETMKGIMTQLGNILERIPRSYAENVRKVMGELIMEPDSDGMAENLKLLKETVLPMLGKYVSTTNDLGATRDRIQLLMQDLSRLNLSGSEELDQRFTELLDYARYNLNLPADKLQSLKNLFEEVIHEKSEPQNEFIDSLAKALTNTDGLSSTGRTMVDDTINALLLNRSVYMPFNHIFLPFMLDGTFMFTEMWVEKDGAGKGAASDKSDAMKRVYLNFDIQGLGKFQAAIGLTDNSIDCLLNCPESVADSQADIETDIAKIFTDNGFSVNSIQSSNDTFKTELEVLHKIYEGRGSINVTV